MQGVAKFVEESFHLRMAEQRWLVLARRRKIAQQEHGWPLIFSLRQKLALDDGEFSEVVVFSLARKHIEIKHAQRLAAGRISHHVKLEIVDPLVGRTDFFEFEPEDVLVDVEHPIEHFLEREICAQRLLIHGELLFVELVLVITPVPYADLRVRVTRISGFHVLHLGNFRCELRLDAADEVINVRFGAGARFGHSNFSLKIVP